MTDPQPSLDPEFAAMQAIFAALDPLEDEARSRVLAYIASRLEIDFRAKTKATGEPETADDAQAEEASSEAVGAPKFATFAQLFDAADPKSNSDKALVAAYWFQVCQGQESFNSQEINKELKHLGHGVANITSAIDTLKAQKPALMLQTKKSGTSQQARKLYMVTAAGIKVVEGMIDE